MAWLFLTLPLFPPPLCIQQPLAANKKLLTTDYTD